MAEKRVLFDTNVVLDVLLNREPWVMEAKALWEANDEGRINGYLAATTLTNIFYIARKSPHSLDDAHAAVRICLEAFEICPVDRHTLQVAAMLQGRDFEDNVQIACSVLASLDAIVTRDVPGFEYSTVPAYSPADMLAQLAQVAEGTPAAGSEGDGTERPTAPDNGA